MKLRGTLPTKLCFTLFGRRHFGWEPLITRKDSCLSTSQLPWHACIVLKKVWQFFLWRSICFATWLSFLYFSFQICLKRVLQQHPALVMSRQMCCGLNILYKNAVEVSKIYSSQSARVHNFMYLVTINILRYLCTALPS